MFNMGTSKTLVLKLMAPLLLIGYVGGQVPNEKRKTGHKIYASCLLILFTCSYAHVCYGRSMPLFNEFSFLVKFSDTFVTGFLLLSCGSCIISIFFVNPRNSSSIIKNLLIFDQRIGIPVETKYKHFYILLIISNVEVIGLLCADSWLWLDNLGLQMYNIYLIRNVQFYFMEMKKILIYWIAVEICSRFEILVDSLKSSFILYYRKDIFYNRSELLKRMKMISNLHNRLCDTIDMLNRLYGITIVFDVLFAIVVSLEYSILNISLAVVKAEILSVHFGTNLTTVCWLWIADSFVSIEVLMLHMELTNSTIRYRVIVAHRLFARPPTLRH